MFSLGLLVDQTSSSTLSYSVVECRPVYVSTPILGPRVGVRLSKVGTGDRQKYLFGRLDHTLSKSRTDRGERSVGLSTKGFFHREFFESLPDSELS